MNANVLLVEDNADFVDNLRDIIEATGHLVRTASSCAQALEVGKGWVHVALVDLRLPDGDGTTLAQALKQQTADCEVILLTGHASVESAAAAVRAGVWDYLVKPCATPDLLTTLEKAVRHVRALTEKRELSRRAQVAEKLAAVGTLTAGLSHEIRNPLNAAGLQLSVLERRLHKLDPALQPTLLEPLTLVRDEIRRLEHILQDFLQFARPTSLNVRPTDLHALLEKVVAFMSTDAERRKVHLTTELKPCVVSGDADQLRQVFMNLVLNALDAAPPGGHVHVTAGLDADARDFAMVHVDDDGPGIAPAHLERIFEPFFTTKAQGSGLGLPITNAIVTQHGGTITIGRSPLAGARFSIRLPLVHLT